MPLSAQQLSTVKQLLRDASNQQRSELNQFMRNVGAAQTMAELAPGDVCIISGIRPKYLNGQRCTVVSLRQTKVVAQIAGEKTNCVLPASCLTKIS